MVGITMFHYLYKTLLIAIISGSLSIMNVTALAQEAGVNTTATAQMSKASSSGLTRDSNGVLKKNESHNFEGTKGKDDNAIHVITMLAVGVIGTKLLTYKKWTLDMTVVAAASVAYIAAEIVNIMNLKNQLEDMNIQVTKSSDGKVDQTQIETLEKLKESYQKVQKSAKTKKMLQMAAAAAFGGALAIAAYQRFTEEGQFASCEIAIAQAETELANCVTTQTALAAGTGPGAVKAAAEAGYCSMCGGQMVDMQAGFKTNAISSQAMPQMSMLAAQKAIPAEVQLKMKAGAVCGGTFASAIKAKTIPGACVTYLETKKAHESYGNAVNKVGEINPGLNKMLFSHMPFLPIKLEAEKKDPLSRIKLQLQNGLDFIFPKAEAGMVAMLGLAAGAATAFFGAQTAMGQAIDEVMFTPGGRIIAWGIFAGAALLGAQATQKEIDNIDGHIAKIDQILKDMNTLKSGIKSNNVNEQQIKLASFQANANQDIPLNPNPNVKTDCIASSGSSNCAALSDTIRSMPGFADLPDSFKSIASQSAKLGDGLSGANSISGSTLATAGSLAGKQSAIAKLGTSLKTKINDSLANSGKPKIDFAKQEKDLWNKMKAQTSKALKANGMSGGSFLSSTGISPISSTAPVPQMAVSKKPASGFGSGAAALPAGDAKDKNKDFELDFSDTSAVADGGGMGSGAEAKEEAFDIGTNDINTNTGDSIFQVISNRYIKSGYPKLLDEIPVKN